MTLKASFLGISLGVGRPYSPTAVKEFLVILSHSTGALTAFNGIIGTCIQVLMLIGSYAPAADHIIHTNTERAGKKKSGKQGNSASHRTSLVLYNIYPTPLSQHSFHRRIFTNGRDERSRPSLHASPREQRSSRSRVLPQILSIVSKSRDLENGLYLRSTFVDLNLHAGTLFSNRMSNSPYDRPLVERQWTAKCGKERRTHLASGIRRKQ
jgi:hypothetical protein